MDLYFKIKLYEEMIAFGILVLMVVAYIILYIWAKKK